MRKVRESRTSVLSSSTQNPSPSLPPKRTLMNLFAGQEQRNRYREQTSGHGVGKESVGQTERVALTYIYTTIYKIYSQWEAAIQHRELNLVLCDNLGWGGVDWGRGEAQEGGAMCIHIADSLHRTAEINTALQSNYISIKKNTSKITYHLSHRFLHELWNTVINNSHPGGQGIHE